MFLIFDEYPFSSGGGGTGTESEGMERRWVHIVRIDQGLTNFGRCQKSYERLGRIDSTSGGMVWGDWE